MASSAVYITTATKTAAVIKEVNDEVESGWIFGMINGTVASVVTGRDDLWDELDVDSESVSTACSYSWCAHKGVNDKEKACLQDIQQRRIPSHGSRAALVL